MVPLQLAIYKGLKGTMGAVQFNLQKPHYYVKTSPKLKNFDGKFIKKEWLETNPSLTPDLLVSREGCLFMEITSATAPNVYDWDKEVKIVMALSITDMGKLLMVLEGAAPEVAITHDPGAKSDKAGQVNKRLTVSSPKGIKTGVLIKASMRKADGETVSHMVGLTGDETKTLSVAIRAIIPAALAWV